MTREEIIAKINESDGGPYCAGDSGHIALLFSDGQIDSTKGGDLYGMRNQFTFEGPICPPIGKFRRSMSKDENRIDLTFILCTHEKAKELRELLKNWARTLS